MCLCDVFGCRCWFVDVFLCCFSFQYALVPVLTFILCVFASIRMRVHVCVCVPVDVHNVCMFSICVFDFSVCMRLYVSIC